MVIAYVSSSSYIFISLNLIDNFYYLCDVVCGNNIIQSEKRGRKIKNVINFVHTSRVLNYYITW